MIIHSDDPAQMATHPNTNDISSYDDDNLPLGLKTSQYNLRGSNTSYSPYLPAGAFQPPPYAPPGPSFGTSYPSVDQSHHLSKKSGGTYQQNPFTPRSPLLSPSSPYALPASPSPSSPSSPSYAASGSKKNGFMNKLTTPDLLNPPPPSFGRPPPPNLPYPPFPQCIAIGKSSSLKKGFPALPPHSRVQPHPFVTHDVNEEDWTRFIGDVKKASKLSIMEHVVAGAVPAVFGITIVGAIIASQAIKYGMRRKKRKVAAILIEHWNHHFFNPRRIEVSLVRGQTIYTGTGTVPVEMLRDGYARQGDTQLTSDSDHDEEDGESHHDPNGQGRPQGEKRKKKKKGSSNPWKLVVTYR